MLEFNLTMSEFENACHTKTKIEINNMCRQYGWLATNFECQVCGKNMSLTNNNRSVDKESWRCYDKECVNYKRYFSVRIGSFFEFYKTDLSIILRILAKYGNREKRHTIISSTSIAKTTVKNIISDLVGLIPDCDWSENKLGIQGSIVQGDETMGNYKCKSHRGRSPNNRTDFLTLVEVINGHITRGYAKIIPDKSAKTIQPIIQSQVLAGAVIHTDEHRAYMGLKALGFRHGTVCHKNEFVNDQTGVNTQAVESFNNTLKLEIKIRKGVKTVNRDEFLREFLFYFNNKNNFFKKVMMLIKI